MFNGRYLQDLSCFDPEAQIDFIGGSLILRDQLMVGKLSPTTMEGLPWSKSLHRSTGTEAVLESNISVSSEWVRYNDSLI